MMSFTMHTVRKSAFISKQTAFSSVRSYARRQFSKKTHFRGVLSFESRFQIPEGGMETPQYMSRGSAILLEQQNQKSGKRMAGIVTSTHIAHPFSTPFYYEEAMSWLSQVRPHHCTFYVSVCGPNGPVWEMELDRDMLNKHESQDICMFQFPSSEADWFLNELAKLDASSLVSPVAFQQTVDAFPAFSNVTCVGYDYSQDTSQETVVGNRFKSVPGRITSSELQWALRKKVGSDGKDVVRLQEFIVQTEEKLRFGMCGGPVVLGHDPSNLVGVVEGIDYVSGVVHCLPADTMWGMFDESK